MVFDNLVNTIIAYYYIDVPLLSYMCGTSIIVLMFLYFLILFSKDFRKLFQFIQKIVVFLQN